MGRGSWDDFTDKYGFGDGEETEGRDFAARDILIRLLNNRLLGTDTIVFGYDRPGCHNSCLIIVTKKRKGLTPDDHQELWLSGELSTKSLPEEVSADVDELINEAYDQADKKPIKKRQYIRMNLATGETTVVER